MLCSVYCYLVTDVSGQPIDPEKPVTTNQPCVKTPEDRRAKTSFTPWRQPEIKRTFLAFAFSHCVKARKT